MKRKLLPGILMAFFSFSSCTITGMNQGVIGTWIFSSGTIYTNFSDNSHSGDELPGTNSTIQSVWYDSTQLTSLATNTFTVYSIFNLATVVFTDTVFTINIPGVYNGSSTIRDVLPNGFRVDLNGVEMDFGYNVAFGSLTLSEYDGTNLIKYFLYQP